MVIAYLLKLAPEERERFIQQLDHELRGPLRKVGIFSGLICEDERKADSEIKPRLKELASQAAALCQTVKSLSQAGSEREFRFSLEQITRLVEEMSLPLPESPQFIDPDSIGHYQRLGILLRRIDYTYRTFFNLADSEHFSFRVYLKLFPFLNQSALREKSVSFTDKSESFPFETETGAYALVMDNLLGNALTHGFPGSSIPREKREISVTTRGNYTPYLVRVYDNGAGIDTEKVVQQAVERGLISARELNGTVSDLERALQQKKLSVPEQYAQIAGEERRILLLNQLIFLPRITTSAGEVETEAVHGTSQGLGLDLVRSLVESNGGKVWVKSQPGDTRFYFTVPSEKIVNYKS